MNTEFELFDLISGNVLDTFEREADAIEALVEIALERGEGQVARFALIQDRAGQSTLIAMKDDLVRIVALELERGTASHAVGGDTGPTGRYNLTNVDSDGKLTRIH